jgi:hypothetical protein
MLTQQYGKNPLVNPIQGQQFSQNPFVNPIQGQQFGQNPFVNPMLAQQYGQNPFVNPLLAQQFGSGAVPQYGSQPYALHPALGHLAQQFGQTGSPFGQTGPLLAPQSWVGQPGVYGGGHGLGQIHPLIAAQQMANRGLHGAGVSPWTLF